MQIQRRLMENQWNINGGTTGPAGSRVPPRLAKQSLLVCWPSSAEKTSSLLGDPGRPPGPSWGQAGTSGGSGHVLTWKIVFPRAKSRFGMRESWSGMLIHASACKYRGLACGKHVLACKNLFRHAESMIWHAEIMFRHVFYMQNRVLACGKHVLACRNHVSACRKHDLACRNHVSACVLHAKSSSGMRKTCFGMQNRVSACRKHDPACRNHHSACRNRGSACRNHDLASSIVIWHDGVSFVHVCTCMRKIDVKQKYFKIMELFRTAYMIY